MAFTERFCTTSGSSGNTGTNDTSDAWDLVTGLANMTSGIRLNVKAGSYSIGTGSLITYGPSSDSTAASPTAIRGYNSTPGDLGCSRDSAGKLVTTNFPEITMAYQCQLLFKDYTFAENLKIIGQRTNGMLQFNNHSCVYNCYIEDSGTTGNALALFCDTSAHVAYCDVVRTVQDGGGIAVTNFSTVANCRVQGHASGGSGGGVSTAVCCSVFGCTISNMAYGIYFGGTSAGYSYAAVSNTIYNASNCCFFMPNTSNAATNIYLIADNHATDSNRFIDANYYASGTTPVVCLGNRTRDIANADRGVGDWPTRGAVTTDNGGASTDYVDTSTNNLMLRASAAGRNASIQRNKDIGGTQAPMYYNSSGGG